MSYGKVGDNEFSIPVLEQEIKVVNYSFDDLGAVDHSLHIAVEPGTIVVGVMHEVVEVFDGGVPSLIIGDTIAQDGFVAAIAPTTLGLMSNSLGSAQPYKAGKKFNTLGEIIVTHAAGLTAGKGKVFITTLNYQGNWRKPAV